MSAINCHNTASLLIRLIVIHSIEVLCDDLYRIAIAEFYEICELFLTMAIVLFM